VASLAVERDRQAVLAAVDAQALDAIELDHIIRTRPSRQRPSNGRKQADPRRLAHHHHAQLPVGQAFAGAGAGQFQPVIIVADEQQRRVDPGLLIVDRQRQPLVLEADQRP
jgi:hypothetical protein